MKLVITRIDGYVEEIEKVKSYTIDIEDGKRIAVYHKAGDKEFLPCCPFTSIYSVIEKGDLSAGLESNRKE